MRLRLESSTLIDRYSMARDPSGGWAGRWGGTTGMGKYTLGREGMTCPRVVRQPDPDPIQPLLQQPLSPPLLPHSLPSNYPLLPLTSLS